MLPLIAFLFGQQTVKQVAYKHVPNHKIYVLQNSKPILIFYKKLYLLFLIPKG